MSAKRVMGAVNEAYRDAVQGMAEVPDLIREHQDRCLDEVEAEARSEAPFGSRPTEVVDVAEAVESPSEVERLAAEPGPGERYIDAEDETVREGWRIHNLASLDWALSRIADLEREQAENAEIVGEQIDRLRARLEKLNETAERGLKFFRSHVTAYAEEHRSELLGGGKKKSRVLPSGVIRWKEAPAKAVVSDEAALLEWARAQPVEEELVRIKEEANWAAIKKRIEASGEVLPGTEYVPASDKLTIKTEAK